MGRFFARLIVCGLSVLCVQILTQTHAQEAPDFLQENMLYSEARPLLLAHGWQPYNFGIQNQQAQLSACLERVNAINCTPNSISEFCLESIEICTSLPEFETCGAGPCMMIMEKDGQQLFLSTEGDIGKNNRDKEFVVTGWRFDVWKP